MKIAVIHHRLRGDAAADADALASAARSACDRGAQVVVCPAVPSLAGLDGAERDDLVSRVEGCVEGAALLISFAADDSGPRFVDTPLGRTALLGGDVCLHFDALREVQAARADAVVWRPGAESDLQAEAVLEFALGCAPMLAGVLVMAECAGGEGGSACCGVSAIIHAGQLVAESAGTIEEVLLADVPAPLGAPEPDLPLPELPPILVQRLAVHEGRKPHVDYLADLS